jgi:hypothetical protein
LLGDCYWRRCNEGRRHHKHRTRLHEARRQDDSIGCRPPECFEQLEADRRSLGHDATWWYDTDPYTGESRPAFTPIGGGRLTFIESRGIRHGDRFVGTFEVKEVTRQGVTRREMWLVDAQPVGTCVGAPGID